MFPFDLDKAIRVAREAVQGAGVAAMARFRRGVEVEAKDDGSPVTAADRDAENVILGFLQHEFPQHSILTEESGAHEGVGGGLADEVTRWIVDPLDGTGRFARGSLLWGPLLALQHQGEIVLGALALPAVNEVYWAARGRGCWRNDERLKVSPVGDWSKANLTLGSLGRLMRTPQGMGIFRLIDGAVHASAGQDLAGGVAVLNGGAEAWIESGVKVWDIAPFKVMVEEAGGKFTDFDGKESIETGQCVVSNGVVHEAVLKAMREGRMGEKA